MATTIIREDDEPISLQHLTREFLEEQNPTESVLFETARLSYQILFSNHILEFDELVKAMVTFDAEWARTHRKYEPMGLNIFGGVPEIFYEEHLDIERPANIACEQEASVRGTLELCRSVNVPEHYAEQIAQRWKQFSWDHEDIHQWQDTDDPLVMSYCFSRLMSPSVAGSPPAIENAREALAVALKLYEQPQPDFRKRMEDGIIVHSNLIAREEALKVAIYLGEIQIALEIMKLTIKVDTLNARWVKTDAYLKVPGIHRVLSLLAAEGLAANCHFIDQETAKVFVKGLKAAMESRIANGQHIPTAKLSWNHLLNKLAKAAWTVNQKNYKKRGLSTFKDVLFPPATKEEIAVAEKQVGKLPNDFKEMVRVANGFRGGWHFLDGGMRGISGIDIGPSIVEYDYVLDGTDLRGDGEATGNMIQIQTGPDADSYSHYMIPPATWKKNVIDRKVKGSEYLYLPICSWDDSRESYSSVREYIMSLVTELEEMVVNGMTEDDEDGEDGENEEDGEDEEGEDEDEEDTLEESEAKRQKLDK